MKILAFDTEGNPPGNFEDRLRLLLSDLEFEYFHFNYKSKVKSGIALFKLILRMKPDLVVMEGTGSAGGVAIILSRILAGIPYVFSSGDAVGPFLSRKKPFLSPFFYLYERALYTFSKGFIGWTPYLCGRALTMGARRTVTAASWAPFPAVRDQRLGYRREIREKLGISGQAIVVGIIGSLRWNAQINYCYGLEIVQAIVQLQAERAAGEKVIPEVVGLIIGGGDGKEVLKELAGEELGKSLLLPGGVPRNEVPKYLAAMDIASLPQSVDGVGSFRYSTKISEYLAAGVPFVTGEIPLAYDFGEDWLWRLPGEAPWDIRYSVALKNLLSRLSDEELERKRAAVPEKLAMFDRDDQIKRVRQFILDLGKN